MCGGAVLVYVHVKLRGRKYWIKRQTCNGNVAAVEDIQGESLVRGPKLLSIKNNVIEIMT